MKQEVVFYKAKDEKCNHEFFIAYCVIKSIHLAELNVIPFPCFNLVPQTQIELSSGFTGFATLRL